MLFNQDVIIGVKEGVVLGLPPDSPHLVNERLMAIVYCLVKKKYSNGTDRGRYLMEQGLSLSVYYVIMRQFLFN